MGGLTEGHVGGSVVWRAGGWLACGGVVGEAKEFVNLCVLSVTRLPLQHTQFPMASHVSIRPGNLT
jgi:hypothetical protein